MSWLFKSNHFHPDATDINLSPPDHHGGFAVKDDLSLLFHGVANFLAPPPPSSSAADSPLLSSSQTLNGIKNDFVEIGGKLKSSFSFLSTNKAVTGISKFASQLLQFDGDHRHVDAVVPGITEEVVRFVKEISAFPQCWTQFPLPLSNDFSMSNSQREHALAMEQLVPEFVALRLNLCSYMNVEKFWIIYFLLILRRLNQHDFEHLSTPKIIEARNMLLLKLGERKHLQAEEYEKPRIVDTYEESREDSERENTLSDQNHILTDITSAVKGLEVDDMSGTEKWLEDTDIDAASLTSCIKLQQEEDVSFSDLDDDGSYSSDRLPGLREAQDKRGSSPDGSSDWIQLHGTFEKGDRQKTNIRGKDSEDESNDWLTVDEFN
ncbi:PREDICTED: uncharacterized protein LOC109362999 isoform X2 [Lupinus angustifolius]|uniref:uncharacterized protein LOC109362999 isoform X2 n=1 Tax=Lupinus angustifolius TaxID=3871 RepID=UPI00092E9C1E|nr:PREDICTED: uncharacterized protein LOC109362999 isoform X2 [Lupinus angustifolius]